jgi:hypothetical protein
MQGYVDLVRTQWLPGRNLLQGISRIVGGDKYAVIVAASGRTARSVTVSDPDTQAELETIDDGLVRLTLTRAENAIVEWTIGF